MSRPALVFEGVSKRYPRGGGSAPSLRGDITRLGAKLLRKAPSARGKQALTDVTFEVEEGTAFALVGPNGAGKSTALKLAARISYPSSGTVSVRGRVGALMEVGAGIHPELTGRENIWLYGTILGLKREEIARKFDDIVEFAGLGQAIGSQVKYYSSGMSLRLGFSVASFLEPDILLVDEALAVGDAAFQAKCVGRMNEMVRSGRTLVFVSHSLPLVRDLCNGAILIDQGQVITTGSAAAVLDAYSARVASGQFSQRDPDDVVAVVSADIGDAQPGTLRTGGPVAFRLELEVDEALDDAVLGIGVTDGRPGNLVAMSMLSTGESMRLGIGRRIVACEASHMPLLPGQYEVWLAISSQRQPVNYLSPRPIGAMIVTEGPPGLLQQADFGANSTSGPVYAPFIWRSIEE